MKLVKLKYTDDRTIYVNPENIAYMQGIKSTNAGKDINTALIQFIDEDQYLSLQYPISDLLRLLERAGVEIICEETLDDGKGE